MRTIQVIIRNRNLLSIDILSLLNPVIYSNPRKINAIVITFTLKETERKKRAYLDNFTSNCAAKKLNTWKNLGLELGIESIDGHAFPPSSTLLYALAPALFIHVYICGQRSRHLWHRTMNWYHQSSVKILELKCACGLALHRVSPSSTNRPMSTSAEASGGRLKYAYKIA